MYHTASSHTIISLVQKVDELSCIHLDCSDRKTPKHQTSTHHAQTITIVQHQSIIIKMSEEKIGDGNVDGWGRQRPALTFALPRDDIEVDVMPSSERRIVPEDVVVRKDRCLPGFNGKVPLGELHQLYVNRGMSSKQMQQLDKYYTVWENGAKSPYTLYTSVFTCPMSGEHFACGNWNNDKGVVVKDQINWFSKCLCVLQLSHLPSPHLTLSQQTTCLETKKDAKRAAAARALDCFSFRRCDGTDKRSFRRCVDAPYAGKEEAPRLATLPLGVHLPTKLLIGEENEQAVKDSVNKWYAAFWKKLEVSGYTAKESSDFNPQEIAGPDCYCSWSNLLTSPNLKFTAIFTCPLTGERFPSGKVRGEDDKYVEDCMFFDPEAKELLSFNADVLNDEVDEGDELEKHNLVWYGE